MKTAILLYLYHTDLWREYKNLILNNCENYDLFLSLCDNQNNNEIISDCKRTFPNVRIDLFENKGVDIGPFLQQIKNLDENTHPYFIKLHSKKSILGSFNTNINWRVDLVNSLVGSRFTYNKNIEYLKKDYVGCIFNKNFLNKDQINLQFKIKKLLKIIGLSYEKLNNSDYMSGSMFASKTALFKKYYDKKFIEYVYDLLEPYGVIPAVGSYNHSMEILNGYIIKNENLKIIDGAVKTKVIYNIRGSKNKLHLVELYDKTCTTKENINIRGKITYCNENETDILWSHTNSIQKYKNIENKLIKSSEEFFDSMFYKRFNSDLKIETKDLENHYINIGKKEGRITKKDIEDVFDSEFYKSTYGIKSNKYHEILKDYIDRGYFGNRIYNKIIIDKNFDYGFYQSYNRIYEDTNFNQYTALKDFLKTNKKCNNKIEYLDVETKPKSICVYTCDLNTNKDVYFLKTNLDIIKKDFEKIFVLYSSTKDQKFENNEVIEYQEVDGTHKERCIKKLSLIGDLTKYNSVCLINDENIIVDSLNYFLNKFLRSGCFLYALTDSYVGANYHIDDSILVFSPKDIERIIEAFKQTNSKEELSRHIIKNDLKLGSLFQINQEKELFWRNLFLNINYFPDILIKNNVPSIHKNNLSYLIRTIPRGYNKKISGKAKGRIQSWNKTRKNLDANSIYNTFKVDIKKIKFCLILHIMNIEKQKEYEPYIEKLKSKIPYLDIHITTNSPRSKNSFKNKGMDIGPFLLEVNKLNKKYDYLIKLHSKNLVAFRDLCFNNIIENIYHHVLLLETNPDNFCSGPRLYLHGIDGINSYTINHFMFRNKIKLQNTEKHFFGGTMFISKYKPLKKFLNKINIKEEYELLETGMVVNNTPTNTHGWERILTYLIPNFYGMKNKFI